MSPAERGFLLLCCPLGDAQARPLSASAFRALSRRVRAAALPQEPERELTAEDLLQLGYQEEEARRIAGFLARGAQLDAYLAAARRLGIAAVTRAGGEYPAPLAKKLGLSAPPVLFCRGRRELLRTRCVALVGSRELREPGRRFARAAGELAAREGFTLVSGGAAGADSEAQEACLRAGGSVIVFAPGPLDELAPAENSLYLADGGFDTPFSVPRALARNRLIHAMGEKTLVAQLTCGRGGTWSGTEENLRRGCSPVFVFDDGSEAVRAIAARGAVPIGMPVSLAGLAAPQQSFFAP